MRGPFQDARTPASLTLETRRQLLVQVQRVARRVFYRCELTWPRTPSPLRGIAPLMSPSTLATVKSVPAHCPYSLAGQKIHDYFVRLGFPEKEAWDIHVCPRHF